MLQNYLVLHNNKRYLRISTCIYEMYCKLFSFSYKYLKAYYVHVNRSFSIDDKIKVIYIKFKKISLLDISFSLIHLHESIVTKWRVSKTQKMKVQFENKRKS